jgi:four helix bundle protein
MRDFKTLEIWKRAVRLAKNINELTQSFPIVEKFGLSMQMKRSGVSIASNIAEGCGRRTTADLRHFIHISIGSCFELETQIEIAFLSHYINIDTYTTLLSDIKTLQKMIIAFSKGLGVRY